MKNIIKYVLKYKGLFSLRLLSTIIKSIVNIIFAIILGNIIDVFLSGKISSFSNTLILCGIFIILELIVFISDGVISAKYSQKTITNMRNDIFNNIMNKDISDFSSNNTGSYISILNNDISLVKTDFIDNIFNLIFQVLCFISTLVVMLVISSKITLAILLLSLMNFITTSIIAQKIAKKKGEYSTNLENLTKTTKDIFSGFEMIKNFNILNKTKSIFNKSSNKVEENRKDCLLLINLIDTITLIFGTITYLTVLVICGYSIYNGTLSAGTSIIVIQLMDSITNPLSDIINLLSSIFSIKEIAEKLKNILTKNVKNSIQNHVSEFKKDLSISNVTFSYNGKKDVLKNINFTFEKNKKYAIVGESGSGKSTLIKLLMRYYDSYTGTISLDGININEIDDNSFYSKFSIIQQNVFMLDDTVQENLCLYNKYPIERIQDAISKSGLTQVISNLENGLETFVGENGENLSGGERQRISIGRALLRNTEIMILDEFTSALDNETALEIENTLLDIPDLTLISITHKLIKNTLEKYDQVIVMRNGEIIEIGSFNQLILNRSYFYSLYYIQESTNENSQLAI
ncbi:ABC transporter ATP-binding protein [uncultured Clostridium sp.]|uniref:ABC transporter ATP-binding protein n=1 Tax=uncultured Clostridium sp. TaxID=59620 RepID=UPI0025F9200A|nr:ABC transporter ATP-binding protein [uncultured Clostridium sp.]